MNYYVLVGNFIVLLALWNTIKVTGSGVFEVRIEEFRNDGGLDEQGRCCNNLAGNSERAVCGHQCRTAFNICFSPYQVYAGCAFGSRKSEILGGNTFEFSESDSYADNIVKFGFNFTWPGSFSVVIEAYHDAGQKSGPLIARMIKSVLMVKPDSIWRTETQSQRGRLLRFSYRVRCDQFNYGIGCSKYCKPRNDVFGHWHCNDDGDKVCRDGWERGHGVMKNYCLKPICLAGCSSSHGYCKQPNECLCRYGWHGTFCDKCVKEPRCSRGTCTEPFQCLCNRGWGGMFCNLDLNFCINHHPCKNGARCRNSGLGSFTCECMPGFTGRRCEYSSKVCESAPCKNGGKCTATTSGYACECPLGYSGTDCQDAYCASNPCENGGLCLPKTDGYQCECQPDFGGELCEVKSGCSQRTCFNGGTCEEVANRTQCRCSAGYSGKYCQQVIRSCTKECNHGLCILRNGVSECVCEDGFVGEQCDLEDPCFVDPCVNGGVCKMESGRYSCICVKGYIGKHCENRKKSSESTAGNTNIIFYPQKSIGMTKTQTVTVGLLSVLIVCLIIGLVICLIYPARKRTGYLRGIVKRHLKTQSVSSEPSLPSVEHPSVESEVPSESDDEESHLRIDVGPAKVQYRNVRPPEAAVRMVPAPTIPDEAETSQDQHASRHNHALPSYQEACTGVKLKPCLV